MTTPTNYGLSSSRSTSATDAESSQQVTGLILSHPPEDDNALHPAQVDSTIVGEKSSSIEAGVQPASQHTTTAVNEASRPIPVASAAKNRPTNVEVFTGQAVAIVDQLFAARESTDLIITSLRKASQRATFVLEEAEKEQKEQIEQLRLQFTDISFAKFELDLQHSVKLARSSLKAETEKRLQDLAQIQNSINQALREYQWNPWQLWLYQWSLVTLLVITGVVQAVFIEFYCRWHGSYFISLDLYNPINVGVLSQIGFVGGATTMSVAAEVLTWSSLGVWANQSYVNTMKMLRRTFRFADDGPRYMGVMMRNTSIAAIIVILLRLSKFSIFGVSLDPTNPLAFDFTVGLSFLLGFFGDDAYRILSNFRDRVVEGAGKKGG